MMDNIGVKYISDYSKDKTVEILGINPKDDDYYVARITDQYGQVTVTDRVRKYRADLLLSSGEAKILN